MYSEDYLVRSISFDPLTFEAALFLSVFMDKRNLLLVLKPLTVMTVSFLVLLVGPCDQISAQNTHNAETDKVVKQIDEMMIRSKEIKRSGNYDLAYQVLDSAMILSKRIDHKKLMALTLSELGVVCMYQGRYSNALEFMHKGVVIRDVLNDSAGLADSYNYIASVHHAQTDHSIALNY